MCELCHSRGWFFYQNWKTKVYEVRHCDQCSIIPDNSEAGTIAFKSISDTIRTAEVMVETRFVDEWNLDTVPCSICFKKGWYLKQNKDGLLQILHCDYCKLISSDANAGEAALPQIATAFELVEYAEEIRESDSDIKDQTAKAFGEVAHQWERDRRVS